MRTVYLLRHAKSDWSDPTVPDAERPLSSRGRRDALLVAAYLRHARIRPELILCSPAKRTRETLELLLDALGSPRVEFDGELYGADSDALLDRLRRMADSVACVMLIAHNPGLQELALQLTIPGMNRAPLEAKFPTTALATITIPATMSWKQLGPTDARLTAYTTPRQLRAEGSETTT